MATAKSDSLCAANNKGQNGNNNSNGRIGPKLDVGEHGKMGSLRKVVVGVLLEALVGGLREKGKKGDNTNQVTRCNNNNKNSDLSYVEVVGGQAGRLRQPLLEGLLVHVADQELALYQKKNKETG